MPVGSTSCKNCAIRPTHQCAPCNHTVCYDCYYKAQEEETCGVCAQIVNSLEELSTKTPTVGAFFQPKDKTWDSLSPQTHSRHSSSTASSMQNSTSQGANGGHWQNRRYNGTTSQGGPTGSHQGAYNNTPRNIPSASYSGPMEIRPESSMCNASFATQAFGHGGVSLNNYGYPYAPHAPADFSGAYGQNGPNYQNDFGGEFNGGYNGYGNPNNYFSNSVQPFSASQGNGYNTVAQSPANPFRTSSNGGRVTALPAPSASTNKAFELASMIRTGATDGPDEPTEYGYNNSQKHSRAGHQAAQTRIAKANAEAILAKQPVITTTELVNMRESNIKGNAAAFLDVEQVALPEWFNKLSNGYKPTVEEFFEVLPVMEPCRYAAPSTAGVIRIRNIPYSTPRSEIAAFVGRNAKMVSQPAGTPYYGVHVIMERHSGKTMDAFIELTKSAEAVFVVSQFQRRILNGRPPKIGDRQVEVEISSQEELMQELFPRARKVTWEGMQPHVAQANEEYYHGVKAAGFTGFLQNEEIVMMVKHAETPNRSPFAQRSPVRTYESMISTLHKYPWFSHENVNMVERRLLFDATLACIRALITILRKGNQPLDQCRPTQSTLQELVVAALTCPGFSEVQKTQIISSLFQGGFSNFASSRGMNVLFGGSSSMAPAWPFKVLIKAPGVNDEFIEYFASLMRLATTGVESVSLAEAHALRASSGTASRFGKVNIDYGSATTMEEVGRIELRWLEEALRRVLPNNRQRSQSMR